MKRRLILARALMHRPRLLILDEPTAGVDVELRLELWHYVQRINAEGTTILLTTHYLEEAEQLCDKIAFINGGEIVAQGTSRRAGGALRRGGLEDAYLELVGRKELSRGLAAARPSRLGARRVTRRADPLRVAAAARGRAVHEDQAPDRRRAAARDVPVHLGLRRGAGLARGQAARLRLRGLRRARPDHDGLGDERVQQQLVARSSSRSSSARSTTSCRRRPRRWSCCWPSRFGGFLRGCLVALLTFLARDRAGRRSRSTTSWS